MNRYDDRPGRYGDQSPPADDSPTLQFPRFRPLSQPGPGRGRPYPETTHPDPAARYPETAPGQPVPPSGWPGQRQAAGSDRPGGGAGGHGTPGGPGPTGGHGTPGGSGPTGGGPDSPAAPDAPDRARRRTGRGRRLVVVGVAVALLAAAGGTAAYAYSGEVPRGARVFGVEVGGESRSSAANVLRAELARRTAQLDAPLTVRVGEHTGQLKPADIGLTVDVEATVAALVEADPHPVNRLFGRHDVTPVVVVDPHRLDARLRQLIGRDSQRMTMPAITFTGTTPKVTRPRPGLSLDPQRSAQVVRDGWLSGQPVVVPLVETSPATTEAELQKLLDELAKPAVSAPVTIRTGRGTVTVSPTAIARSLVLTADATGRITPKVDAGKLRSAIAGQLTKIEVKPKDATYHIVDGQPRPVDGVTGQQLDLAAIAQELLTVLPRRDDRVITAELKRTEPEVTRAALDRLGIKEKVSSFTTYFTGGLSSARSQNIVTIAKDVDGTLVKPGATFSLNGHTGERSYAQGYRDAPVILDGKLVPGVGGGTSQFTTTLFNAIYYAGLEDVEHKPHSYWFSRYPAVIESTIFYPDLDFKFRNNTEYGVVIDTAYTSRSITVSIWSTKIWDSVKTEYSPRRNITKPKVIYLKPGPSCIATNGIDGFTQDAWRVFRKDGREVRREKFTWRYLAEPRYICGTEPGP